MKGKALLVAFLGRWTMLTKLIGCWNKNGTVQKALRMEAAQLIPPLKVGVVGQWVRSWGLFQISSCRGEPGELEDSRQCITGLG